MDLSILKEKNIFMPRKDIDNRNDLGMFRSKFSEPIDHSKQYNLNLFALDSEKIQAIASRRGIPPAELLREIVREYLRGKENDTNL